MVRHPAIQNLILQALNSSQNNSGVIPAIHCSIFMGPAEHKKGHFCKLDRSLWLWYGMHNFWKECRIYQHCWCYYLQPQQGWSSYEECFEELPTFQASAFRVHISISLWLQMLYTSGVWRKWTEFTWFIMEMSLIVPCKTPAGLEALHITSGCMIPWLKWAIRALDPGSVP